MISKNWYAYGEDTIIPIDDQHRLVVSTNRAQEEDADGNDLEYFEHYVTREERRDNGTSMEWQWIKDLHDNDDGMPEGREWAEAFACNYAANVAPDGQ